MRLASFRTAQGASYGLVTDKGIVDLRRYLESIEEITRMTGRAPEHTVIGFASRGEDVVLNASFASVAASYAVPQAS